MSVSDIPLMWACKNSHMAINDLLKYEPKLHCQNNNGNTALHLAVKFRYANIVKLLLNNSAEPNIKCRSGQSSLNLETDLSETTKNKESYDKVINFLKI